MKAICIQTNTACDTNLQIYLLTRSLVIPLNGSLHQNKNSLLLLYDDFEDLCIPRPSSWSQNCAFVNPLFPVNQLTILFYDPFTDQDALSLSVGSPLFLRISLTSSHLLEWDGICSLKSLMAQAWWIRPFLLGCYDSIYMYVSLSLSMALWNGEIHFFYCFPDC